MAETTPTPLITDQDVVTAIRGATNPSERGPWPHEVRAALEAVAPALRARWVSEALEAYNGRLSAFNSRLRARAGCARQLRAFAHDLGNDGQHLTPLGIAAALSAVANAWDGKATTGPGDVG